MNSFNLGTRAANHAGITHAQMQAADDPDDTVYKAAVVELLVAADRASAEKKMDIELGLLLRHSSSTDTQRQQFASFLGCTVGARASLSPIHDMLILLKCLYVHGGRGGTLGGKSDTHPCDGALEKYE